MVWQKSLDLVREIYAATGNLPQAEIYGLVSQMRRAAVSIPSNIAEGYRRKNLKEYIQFLYISYGSSAELETQLLISKDIYPRIDFSKSESVLNEVQKMLNVVIRKLGDIRRV